MTYGLKAFQYYRMFSVLHDRKMHKFLHRHYTISSKTKHGKNRVSGTAYSRPAQIDSFLRSPVLTKFLLGLWFLSSFVYFLELSTELLFYENEMIMKLVIIEDDGTCF